MAAGLTSRPMTIEDMVRMAYADEIAKEEKIKARYRGALTSIKHKTLAFNCGFFFTFILYTCSVNKR